MFPEFKSDASVPQKNSWLHRSSFDLNSFSSYASYNHLQMEILLRKYELNSKQEHFLLMTIMIHNVAS